MKIYIASDHAGFELKRRLSDFLESENFEVEDLGPTEFNPNDDYPDFVYPLAQKVALRQAQGKLDDVGIVIGGSGQGEAIVANKVKGVRAAVYYGNPSTLRNSQGRTEQGRSATSSGLEIVKLSKEHNNANILSLGARFLTSDQAIEAVKLWLETKFTSEERHLRRINKITQLEAKI